MRLSVISLSDAHARREHAAAQLDAAGIEFDFLDAVRGEDILADESFRSYDATRFFLNTGRLPSNGELGCFASHRLLWRRCVEIDEPVLVLEDDVELHGDFRAAVEEVARHIGEYGFIRLQEEYRASRFPVVRCGRFTLSRYRKASYGTACYAISPAVARSFIARSGCFRAPVDLFIKNFWEHGQPLYALTPYTASLSGLSRLSAMHGRRKRRSTRITALRAATKTGWYARRWLFNAVQIYREFPGWPGKARARLLQLAALDD